ncbi:hypothetical protein Tco_0057757 [Tanacetum coccineum]
MMIEESLNVTFDESFLEPNLSSSVEDDRIVEPIVQDLNGSSSLQVNVLDEGYPKSLKEDRGHPIKPVIGIKVQNDLKDFHEEMREIHYSLNNNFKLLCSMVELLEKVVAQRRKK